MHILHVFLYVVFLSSRSSTVVERHNSVELSSIAAHCAIITNYFCRVCLIMSSWSGSEYMSALVVGAQCSQSTECSIITHRGVTSFPEKTKKSILQKNALNECCTQSDRTGALPQKNCIIPILLVSHIFA